MGSSAIDVLVGCAETVPQRGSHAIYGMFIVGGALLGALFLGEPVTLRKLAGIGLAIVSIFLIAGSSGGR